MLNCSFGFCRAFAAIAARLETGSYPSPALRPVGLPASECGSDFLIRHFRLSATPFAPRSLPASPLIWRGLTSRRSYSAACAALLSTSCDQTHGISQVHEQALANMPEPAPPVAEDRLASTPVSLPPSPHYPTGRRPQLFPFRGEAHSSHRFGLSARTAPALTRRLPFASGCVLRLCLLDSKAAIFAYHKLHSRLLAHDSRNKRGVWLRVRRRWSPERRLW